MTNSTNEVKAFSKASFEAFCSLLFPAHCCICREPGRPAICAECESEVQPLRRGSCDRCSIDDAEDQIVCRWMSAVDAMRGACDYRGAGGDAVRRLKYWRSLELIEPMARMMGRPAADFSYDYVVPVPIHWSRRSQRGFNQADELARAARIGKVRMDLLCRQKATWPQARARGAERRLALEGAFAAKPCPGARILLVDDVVTSGGTLEACALTLKAAGAAWVGALVFAVELPYEYRDN